METKKEVKELKKVLDKSEFKPIENPIGKLIKWMKDKDIRMKQKQIDSLTLDIKIKKLKEELGEW